VKLTSGQMVALKLAVELALDCAREHSLVFYPVGTWEKLQEQLLEFVRGDPWETRYILSKEVEADESRESL